MNVVEALQDPALLGALPAFQDLATWRPWLAFLRAVYGLPMDEADLELFRRHTGRQDPRPGGYPEAVVIVGVRSGKSRIAAAVATVEALAAAQRGERGVYVPLIAQDLRGAQRTLFGYVREAFEVPLLRGEMGQETTERLVVGGRVTVAVYPCRAAAVRGITAVVAVVDELAHFITTDGRPTDLEVLRAVRTRLATTGGKLLILSSPYAQAGALWELRRRHYGREDSPTLVWAAASAEMNPSLSPEVLARMAEEDPEAYRSEILGEFRSGLTTLLDPEAIEACVDTDAPKERAPEDRHRYVSFVDAASGSGKDAFTVAVAHPDGERAVLDVVRAWKPPFNPSGVIQEAAELLKRYRLSRTSGDRYAPGFVSEGFRSHGVTYEPSERDRSTIYLELLPAVNAERVVLLNDPDLLRELRGLERRRGTTGRDRVDHRPGSHDDLANSAAGALVLAEPRRRRGGMVREAVWGPGSGDGGSLFDRIRNGG